MQANLKMSGSGQANPFFSQALDKGKDLRNNEIETYLNLITNELDFAW